MAVRRSLAAILGLAVALSAATARAQTPSPQQVQQGLQMLQSDPALASKLQAKIAASGMTPDQIRARLSAAGYSPTLLDAYLPGASNASGSPDSTTLKAASFLGLVDQQAQAAASNPAAASAQANGAPTLVNSTSDANSPAQKGPEIFGLAVFRRSTSQFDAMLAGPVDPSYKLGAGDVLSLFMTGAIEQSYTLEITREGFVVVPQVGQIYVANLTLDAASGLVLQRVRSVYSNVGRGPGAATQFYLTVAKLRTNQVFVLGEVTNPGSYQVSSAGTALTALYAAGGPTDNGSLRKVEVRRGGRTVSTIDLYDYLIQGDASHDVRLENGDILFVPLHGSFVTIDGPVMRPAIYELRDGETLRDVIRMAGGFTSVASRDRVLIRRILPPADRAANGRDRMTIDLPSAELATGFGPAFPLARGDQVQVFEVAPKERGLITVAGAVWKPGDQGLLPGMKITDAIRAAGGLKPDVYTEVQVARLLPDGSRELLHATIGDTTGRMKTDFALQEDDSIRVFAKSDFRPDRWVAITGAVRNGGRFPFHDGMTMRDLVALAGGLDEGAYLDNAEIARLPENRAGGLLATSMTVPLDSSYLLDRTPGNGLPYVGAPGLQASVARAPDVPLKPYDNILIKRQPDWQVDRQVTLLGEVKFPGTYTLLSKTERVSDVIKRAGGLLPTGYPEGAVFTRTVSDGGRVALDLSAALAAPGSRNDFIMLPGDSLAVPRFRPTVRVEGAVNSPLTLAYVPGWKLSNYVDAAGGYTYSADEDRAYVRQPSGVVDPRHSRFWLLPDHDPTPDAGAVITVPTKDPNDRKDWTAIAGSIAQILGASVAILAVITRK